MELCECTDLLAPQGAQYTYVAVTDSLIYNLLQNLTASNFYSPSLLSTFTVLHCCQLLELLSIEWSANKALAVKYLLSIKQSANEALAVKYLLPIERSANEASVVSSYFSWQLPTAV